MRKLQILFVMVLLCPVTLFAQSPKDIFDKREITFFGLDFSKARFIGSGEFYDDEAIKEKYIPAWNNLMLEEREKYDVKKYFRMDDAEYEFDVVRNRNENINVEERVINSNYKLNEQEVQEAVKSYNFDAKNVDIKEGIGLVFIVESLKKFEKDDDVDPIGHYWVTFFDTDSKEVLLTERMKGEPGGFGFRNYWARTYFNVMQKAKEKMKDWEDEYD